MNFVLYVFFFYSLCTHTTYTGITRVSMSSIQFYINNVVFLLPFAISFQYFIFLIHTQTNTSLYIVWVSVCVSIFKVVVEFFFPVCAGMCVTFSFIFIDKYTHTGTHMVTVFGKVALHLYVTVEEVL